MNSSMTQNRVEYVFKYLLRAFLKTEKAIHESLQNLGFASIENVTIDQTLICAIEKDLENLSTKDDQTVNDYFEDNFNLALSNLSQNILPVTNQSGMNANQTVNGLIAQSLNNSANQALGSLNYSEQFSFKLKSSNKENIKDDVLLKFTKHLDNKINLVLKQLKATIEINKNSDLKVLRDRNIELSSQLKEEFKLKTDLVSKLIQADQRASEYFNQLSLNEEELKNLDDLKRQNEELKRQMKQYNIDYRKLIKEKEELDKYKLLFKDNLPDLERKLKNDLENSRQQIELIEKERNEIQQNLVKLRTEKEKQEELNCQLIKELDLQKDNFENQIKASQKQLDNQKKFIDDLTKDRESEIDQYETELNELQDKLKEKESKELNYLEKISEFKDEIEKINDEKQKLDKCYEETCTRLTNESKRNRQLQNLLEEYEKTNEKTKQVEKELRERLTKLEEDLYSQLKLNETLKKNQTEQSQAIVTSFIDNVCEDVEQLRFSANQATMSLNQDQNSTFKNGIREHQQDSLYNSSSIDCTFPDAKKLEEKNMKLNNYVEDILKENRDLNDELKEVKSSNYSLESRIKTLTSHIDKLKNDLNKMQLERKVVESRITEKELKLKELKLQLDEKINDENEANLKRSIESLKNKLHNEEKKVKKLDEKLEKTESNLVKKQDQIYKITNEIERMKNEKSKVENEKLLLQQSNKKLHTERSRLLQEIEELQNERENDFDDNNNDIKEIFETVLQDKDEEIKSLNFRLNEISEKLKECLPTSPVSHSSLTLLDELISYYQKYSKNSQQQVKNHQLNNRTHLLISQKNKLESESYDSLSPIESYEDALTSEDDDICSKLAGIHNNSLEICNLSFHFKNEKGLIKLINEIPDIVTNEKLTKKEINEWQTSFIECFNNKNVAHLLTKNIVSLRPTYLNNTKSTDLERQVLTKQLDACKIKLRNETLKLAKCNANRKALIFQKKYLMNLSNNNNKQWLFNNRHQQIYKRQSSSTSVHGKNRFRIASFAIIASIRIQTMKKKRDFIEHCDQSDLKNRIEQLNELTIKLNNVLKPSVDQYSSFINSLHHPSSNQVPLKTNNNHLNNYLNNHLNDHLTNANYTKATIENLFYNLKEVYDKLGFEDTTLITNNNSSSYSSLSTFN